MCVYKEVLPSARFAYQLKDPNPLNNLLSYERNKIEKIKYKTVNRDA